MKILQRNELGGKKGNKGRKQTFNHWSKLNQINSCLMDAFSLSLRPFNFMFLKVFYVLLQTKNTI